MSGGKKHEILRNMLSVTGIIVVSKIFGFFKQIFIADLFGTSVETDILSLSGGMVGNIEYVLLQILITGIVPVYIHAKEENEHHALLFVSNALKCGSLIAFAAILFLEFSAVPIAKLIAPSYQTESLRRLILYIRIYTPAIFPMLLTAMLNAVLRANHSFVIGELIQINQNIIQIAAVILLCRTLGINSQVIGYHLCVFVNFMIIAVVSRRHWKLLKGHPFYDPYVKKLIRMSVPLLLGYSMNFVNQQVDKILVSGMETGSVTAMHYAAVLSDLVATLTGSVCTVLFTYISIHVAQRNTHMVAELIFQNTTLMITILLPVRAYRNITDQS